MKASLHWINQHVDLSDLDAARIDEILTFAGIEVEGISVRGGGLDGIVVAEVLSSDPHPDADRLSVCRVDDGAGPGSPRQIVCGAKNYRVGDKVPLALPGAVLPGDVRIRKGKLRGVESDGMLCSARELRLSDEHEGLMILDPGLAPGTPMAEVVGADTVFEIEITPNRPDLLSHLGLAREISALTGRPLAGPPACHAAGAITAAGESEIRLAAADRCPLYSARRISGVRVGPSPDWLRRRLESVGLRPINNIVDITNFVLLEMGQPLHAFDRQKLDGGIVVRPAEAGERFLALDGGEYVLESDDLVIADQSRPVAIAGVMGGEESGVTEATTDVLLESAWFEPSGIRRTSRRLGLTSDSSYRFERGIDPTQVIGASELAVRLITEIAGGTPEPSTAVAGTVADPQARDVVAFDHERCRRLLGIDLAAAEIGRILTALGLSELPGSDGGAWEIPGFRLDLRRPVDLYEEVSRVHGLGDVPPRMDGVAAEPSDADRRHDFAMRLRRLLVARGFHEAQTIKLISAAQAADDLLLAEDAVPIAVRNPLSDDHTALRRSLLPGLLGVLARNVRMGAVSHRMFEIGTVFGASASRPEEETRLGLVLAGDEIAGDSWALPRDRRTLDLFDLRGVVEFLCPGAEVGFVPSADPGFLLSADILVGDRVVGRAVQLHPSRARAIDIAGPLAAAEIDLSALLAATERVPRFRELPRYPAVSRDVAIELPIDCPNADVARFFGAARSSEPLLEDARVFDVFIDPSGANLPADRKSLAYSLTYRDSAKTLTSEEVDAVHGRILDQLKKALPAQIR